tara:strand:+ start:49668 stop:50813 length:1146 start_codon:yes stop_codon:yes gene_type:complete
MTKPVSLPASPFPSDDLRLTIDLDALVGNVGRYRALAHGADVAGVVKADAYGLGFAPVVRAMAGAGVTRFFVTNVVEGAALRAVLPDATIYLTNGLPQGAEDAALAANLSPCLGSLAELAVWTAASKRVGRPLPAALHFDTGISRLGFDSIETAHLLTNADMLDSLDLSLVLSHLACSDEPSHALNDIQLQRFKRLAAAFPDTPKSLANSAGVLLGAEYCFDLVRPGYAIYGGNPVVFEASPVMPVVLAEARVLQVREVDPGEAAGYGATWVSSGPRRLATLATGYSDGYFRWLGSANGAARVFLGGHYAPVAGRVSMDLLIVDVTDMPKNAVKRGDFAELIGPNVPLEEVAARAGTIGYEVLTSLGNRYTRRYTGASAES